MQIFVIAACAFIVFIAPGIIVSEATRGSSADLAKGCARHSGVSSVAAPDYGAEVIVCKDGKVWQR